MHRTKKKRYRLDPRFARRGCLATDGRQELKSMQNTLEQMTEGKEADTRTRNKPRRREMVVLKLGPDHAPFRRTS